MKPTRVKLLLALLLCLSATVGGCPQGKPKLSDAEQERSDRLRKRREARAAADKKSLELGDATLASLKHAWPPEKGKPYPDLCLFNREGKPTRLSAFRGKVILLEFVDTTNRLSIANVSGPGPGYRGVKPVEAGPRLDKSLAKWNVDTSNPDFVHLQVIFFSGGAPPTAKDAQDWFKHWKLSERLESEVVYADPRYQVGQIKALVGGLHGIDRDFKFNIDCTGPTPPDDYVEGLVKKLRAQLKTVGVPGKVPQARVKPDRKKLNALAQLLVDGKFEALQKAYAELAKQGYSEDNPGETHLRRFLDLHEVESVKLGHFDAWVTAMPKSYFANLTRGWAQVQWGWRARGRGMGHTVTPEGWRSFAKGLAAGSKDLKVAAALDPSLPYAFSFLLTWAIGSSSPAEVMESYFQAALKADANFLPPYRAKLIYLLPKWGGTTEGALQFAYEAVEANPKNISLKLMLLEAHFEVAGMTPSLCFKINGTTKTAERLFKRPELAKVCDEALAELRQRYPKAPEVLQMAYLIAKLRGKPGLEHLQELAKLDDTLAKARLGDHLITGKLVPQDLSRGIRLLLEAANEGSAYACGEICEALVYNDDFENDPAAAIPWLRLGAADSSWCRAQLGLAYHRGRGIKVDLAEAVRWYRSAPGYDYSRKNLAEILKEHPKLRLPDDAR